MPHNVVKYKTFSVTIEFTATTASNNLQVFWQGSYAQDAARQQPKGEERMSVEEELQRLDEIGGVTDSDVEELFEQDADDPDGQIDLTDETSDLDEETETEVVSLAEAEKSGLTFTTLPARDLFAPDNSHTWCKHKSKQGLYCELLPDHPGPHGLREETAAAWKNHYHMWDDNGEAVVLARKEDKGVVFVGNDMERWCGHTVNHKDQEWCCEREKGHDGLHMLRPGRYPTAPPAWDDEGIPIEAIVATTETGKAVEFTDERSERCGHRNKHNWACERPQGHVGAHMLTPGRYKEAPLQTWGADGDEIVLLDVKGPDVVWAVGDDNKPRDGMNICHHENRHGWSCERKKGHPGPHRLRPGRYESAPYESWDNGGDPVAVDASIESDEATIKWGDEKTGVCRHVGPEKVFCQRVPGHGGLHMAKPEYSPNPWNDNGRDPNNMPYTEDVRKRVNVGASWLDDHVDDWWNKVNPDTLDEDHHENCVLGQLYGSFDEGVESIYGDAWAENGYEESAHKAGFTLKNGGDFAPLTEAWKDAINQRRRDY